MCLFPRFLYPTTLLIVPYNRCLHILRVSLYAIYICKHLTEQLRSVISLFMKFICPGFLLGNCRQTWGFFNSFIIFALILDSLLRRHLYWEFRLFPVNLSAENRFCLCDNLLQKTNASSDQSLIYVDICGTKWSPILPWSKPRATGVNVIILSPTLRIRSRKPGDQMALFLLKVVERQKYLMVRGNLDGMIVSVDPMIWKRNPTSDLLFRFR